MRRGRTSPWARTARSAPSGRASRAANGENEEAGDHGLHVSGAGPWPRNALPRPRRQPARLGNHGRQVALVHLIGPRGRSCSRGCRVAPRPWRPAATSRWLVRIAALTQQGTEENTASMIAHQERCDFLAKVRRDALAAGRRAHCDLLRDLFGYPARPVAVDGTWRTPAVRSVAQVIYDEGRFEDLPILADAVEEAGCGNTEVLSHLRGPVRHVKGCWVLDALLGGKVTP